MMCNSPGEAYAWMGSALIHLSFISIILWSATTSYDKEDANNNEDEIWKIGLACSAVYAAILFALASWLETKLTPSMAATEDSADAEATSSSRNLAQLVVNLTYGAAVLSLGVPGCFVVLRAIDCCTSNGQLRIRNAAMLGLVSLPVSITSVLIWRNKKLSSMIATALIGLSLVLRNLCMLVDPHMDMVAVGTFILGAILVLYLTRVYLVTMTTTSQQDADQYQHGDKTLLHVGLVLCALVYFYGAWDVFFPDNLMELQQQAKIWHMVGATILCFLPLAILGVASDCPWLSMLGAVGLFLDALRVAHVLSTQAPDAFEVPVYSAVLAVTGLAIGALGLLLDHYKVPIQEGMKVCLGCSGNHSNNEATEPIDASPLISSEI